MAKLKLQVAVLALCLAGVLVAKHYVKKIVEASPAAEAQAVAGDATVEVKAPTP